MLTNQGSKMDALTSVMKEIACPINAMKISGEEVFCLGGISCSNKRVNEISLGNIPSDILNHCGKCPIKMSGEKAKAISVINADEQGNIPCKATGYSSAEKCMGCTFLNRDGQFKILEGMTDDAVVNKISCGYPFLASAPKVFLKKKQEDAL